MVTRSSGARANFPVRGSRPMPPSAERETRKLHGSGKTCAATGRTTGSSEQNTTGLKRHGGDEATSKTAARRGA